MTVLTTVLAMLTTALGIGDGSDMMRPMAITLIGGLVYGTVLTLIVIPCIYDMFHREKEHGRRGIIVNFTEIFLTKREPQVRLNYV